MARALTAASSPSFASLHSAISQPLSLLKTPCALQELLEAAKQQLGFPFREDGPPLGYEFDDIPAGPPPGGAPAAGLSTGSSGGGRKRKAGGPAAGLASPPFKDNDEDDPDFVMAGGEWT